MREAILQFWTCSKFEPKAVGRSCLVTCSERQFVKATGQIGIDSPNLNIKLDTIHNFKLCHHQAVWMGQTLYWTFYATKRCNHKLPESMRCLDLSRALFEPLGWRPIKLRAGKWWLPTINSALLGHLLHHCHQLFQHLCNHSQGSHDLWSQRMWWW